MREKAFVLFVVILLGALQSGWAIDPDNILTRDLFRMQGEYYEAEVPDTLDLAERGRLAVEGLTNFLDPDRDYGMYLAAGFSVNPPFMSHWGGGEHNWGKIAESLVKMRLISGSKENLDIEEKMLKGMVRRIQPDGNFYIPAGGVTLQLNHYYMPVTTARVMMALMALNDRSPGNSQLEDLIKKMGKGIQSLALTKDGMTFFPTEITEREQVKDEYGLWQVEFINGSTIRGLCRYSDYCADPEALTLAGKIKDYVLLPKFWSPEAAPKAITPEEHGQWDGHHHSWCSSMMGLIWYAELTHDVRLKQFVREGYEFLRNFGIARIGLFGENCTVGDMTFIALKLSEWGVGDYWEDVDCYVRNHLTELQITDADRLRRAVETMPKQQGPLEFPYEKTTDRVIERNVGCWLSDGSHPSLIHRANMRWTICCSGNCPPSVYAAWDSIVRYQDGVAQVNLLLNRASDWLDIDSYLPYEGKVVIRNKKAKTVSVRIPRWANKDSVRVASDGKEIQPFWVGRYIVIESVKSGDEITLQFPVKESVEKYTLKWVADEVWRESTNPGKDWKPLDNPDQFLLTFRGNTLVDVSPRPDKPGYPLYLRNEMKAGQAPMKKVTRYIPPTLAKW